MPSPPALLLTRSPLALGERGCFLPGREEALSQGCHLAQSAGRYLARLLVPAKKLFADEEHSYTEAIAGNVLVMPFAGADLLAILHGIAAEGHSRAIEVAVVHQVLGQPSLDLLYDVREGEEAVGPPLHVALRHAPGPLQGLLEADLLLHSAPLLAIQIEFITAFLDRQRASNSAKMLQLAQPGRFEADDKQDRE